MTLQGFIAYCNTAVSADEIYEVYYNDSALCEEIFHEAARLGVDLSATPEPMRASLEAIGMEYGVKILANW